MKRLIENWHLSLWLIVCLLFGGWTYTYDTDTPLGSDAPSTLDDHDRLTKDALQERLAVNHYFALTGTQCSHADTGMHTVIDFQAPLDADPTTIAANQAKLYIKDVSEIAELHWIDESENSLQITSGGYIAGASLKDDSVDEDAIQLANNNFLKALDAAGTGTVSIIKANTNDAVQIWNSAALPARLTTSDPPTAANHIANKKYVDDQITAGADPSYTGGNPSTHTFGGGLIIKMGTETASPGANSTVTFAVPFPNALIAVVVTGNTNDTNSPCVDAKHATDSFDYIQGGGGHSAFDWIAIGY